jgi:hypothetical protein
VPIDQETLRQERVRVAEANRAGDWSQREAELIARDRAELAKQREVETHERELAAFASFCQRKAETAKGTEDEALWDRAAEAIKAGKWPIARRLSADPEMTRWQGLRSHLNYRGENRRLDD